MSPLDFRLGRTATGKPELTATGECTWEEFPHRAQAVVDHFGMTVSKKVDGPDQRLWIARLGTAQFCISWDIWSPEASIMAWEQTPDSEVERLAGDTSSARTTEGVDPDPPGSL